MKIMSPPSKGPMQALLHSAPPTLQPATADPRLCETLLDTLGQVWVSLLWDHCSFLLGPGAQDSVCAHQESVSLVLCKFWQLCGGVNGDLLQEVLCYTHVYCTQSPSLQQSTADTYLLSTHRNMNGMKRQKGRALKNELLRLVGAQYAIGDQWRNNSRKNEEMEPKQKQYPAGDVTGD